MKKTLLFLVIIFQTTISNAQFVTIPDANFVTWLNNNGYTSCMNGNMLDTTCSLVLNATAVVCFNSSIQSLEGIQYFKALTKLRCDGNALTSLPQLSNTINYLSCNGNDLVQLPVLPSALDTLACDQNQLTSLPTLPSGLVSLTASFNNIASVPTLPASLQWLGLGANSITVLPPLPPGLKSLACYQNQIQVIPPLPSTLFYLQCMDNQITSLPALPGNLLTVEAYDNLLTSIPTLPSSLAQLLCDNNLLTALPPLQNIHTLKCSDNSIVSFPPLPSSLGVLEMSGNPVGVLPNLPNSLTWLKADDCQLTNLPANLPPGLTLLYVRDNLLTQLPALPNTLVNLWCQDNQLTSMPSLPNSLKTIYSYGNLYSTFPELPDSVNYLHIGYNPNLTCLPRLKRIVTLRFDVANVQCIPNYGNVTNSTPPLASLPICDLFNGNNCDFYYNIAGQVYSDQNSNCLNDPGESYMNNCKINLYQNSTLVQQGYSSQAGLYTLNTGLGTFDYTVDTVNTPYLVNCPPGGFQNSTLTITDSTDIDMDFGLACKPGFDIGVQSIVRDSGIFRPGNHVVVTIKAGDLSKLYNLDCANGIGGTLTIYFAGPVSFAGPVAGSLIPVTGSNFIQYTIADYGTINFDDEFSFRMLIDITALAGQTVCFVADITPLNGDYAPANNQATHCFNVVNSFDPNDKQVSPVAGIEVGQEWLEYQIRFQNTGTAPAQHIVITDTLASEFDEASFTFLTSSHDPFVEVIGNVVRFNFPNIELPDSTSDEPNSHGYVQYKVKLDQGLPIGTTIENSAAIYFDFNPPVVTNTTINTVIAPTGIQENNLVIFTAYPNPAEETLNIYHSKSGRHQVSLTDFAGRNVFISEFTGNEYKIDVSSLAPGMYFVQIDSENQQHTMKIVVK